MVFIHSNIVAPLLVNMPHRAHSAHNIKAFYGYQREILNKKSSEKRILFIKPTEKDFFFF